MSSPKKITQYMREQLAVLSPEDVAELINKTKFTPEQRKTILQLLGEISQDPKATPGVQKAAEEIKEAVTEKRPISSTNADTGSVQQLLAGMKQTLGNFNSKILEIEKQVQKDMAPKDNGHDTDKPITPTPKPKRRLTFV